MPMVFVTLLTVFLVYVRFAHRRRRLTVWGMITAFGRITMTTGAIPYQRLIRFYSIMTPGLAITCDVIIFNPADFNEAGIFIFVMFIIFMAVAASSFRIFFKMR